jgi:hypothetical protein
MEFLNLINWIMYKKEGNNINDSLNCSITIFEIIMK